MSLEIKTGFMTAAELEELEKKKKAAVGLKVTGSVTTDGPKIDIATAQSKVGTEITVTPPTPKPDFEPFVANDLASFMSRQQPDQKTTTAASNSGVANFMEARTAKQTNLLQQTINIASMNQPDREAEILRVSKEFNIAPSIVRTNLEELQRKSTIKKIDFETLQATNPILSDQLKNISFANVAHDDLEALGSIESAFNWVKEGVLEAPENASSGWDTGTAIYDLGKLGTQIRNSGGDITPDLQAQIDSLHEILQSSEGDGFINSAAQILGTMYPGTRDAATEASGFALGVAGTTFVTAEMMTGPAMFVPDPSDPLIAAGAAATGLAAFGPKMWTGMATNAFDIEGGISYLDLIEMGATHENANNISVVVGSVNAALEMVSVSVVSKPFRKAWTKFIGTKVTNQMTRGGLYKDLLAAYLLNMAVEPTTEWTQEFANIVGENFAAWQDEGVDIETLLNTPEGREKAWERMTEVFKTTAEGMALLALPGVAVTYANGSSQVAQAEQSSTFFNALADGSINSNLVGRLPETAQEFIKKVAEDGGTETVFIDHQKLNDVLNQRGIDPSSEEAKEFFQDLGIEDQLAEVSVTGGDIAIPIEKYATNIAGTDIHPSLAPHIRVKQEHWSTNESENWLKNNPDFKANFEAIEAEAARVTALNDSEREKNIVYKEVFSQLIGQGTSREDATAQSIMYSAVFEVLGKESNVSPAELFEKYGLNIQRVFDEKGNVTPKPELIDVVDEVIKDKQTKIVTAEEEAAYETTGDITSAEQIPPGTKIEWDGKNWIVDFILEKKDKNKTTIMLTKQGGNKDRQTDQLGTSLRALTMKNEGGWTHTVTGVRHESKPLFKSRGALGWNKDFVAEPLPAADVIIPLKDLTSMKISMLKELAFDRDIDIEEKAKKGDLVERIYNAQAGVKQAPIEPKKPKVNKKIPTITYLIGKGGLKPDSDLVADLIAQDIKIPGLYREATTAAGASNQAYDNIPVADFRDATGLNPIEENGYVSVDWLFERIVDENSGNATLAEEDQSRMDVYERDLTAYEEELVDFEKTTEDVNTDLQEAQRADADALKYDMTEMTDFLENTLGIDLNNSTPEEITALIEEQLYDPQGKVLDQAAFAGTGLAEVFEKFSTNFIGTGEGNQAFGWGLYFASQLSVAKWYQTQNAPYELTLVKDGERIRMTNEHKDFKVFKNLMDTISDSKGTFAFDERSIDDLIDQQLSQVIRFNNEKTEYQKVLDTSLNEELPDGYRFGRLQEDPSIDTVFDIEPDVFFETNKDLFDDTDIKAELPDLLTLEMARDWAGDWVMRGLGKTKADVLDSLETYIEMQVDIDILQAEQDLETLKKYDGTTFEFKNTGRVYEVNLAPAEEDYLVWDWSIQDQSKKVKQVIKDLRKQHNMGVAGGVVQGRDVYKHIGYNPDLTGTENNKIPQRTSEELLRRGIRGIKFADGNTRYTDNPNWNYVIFDDKDISITKSFNQEAIEPSEPELSIEEFIEATQYQGSHQAPVSSYGAPGHNVADGMFPEDVYGPNGNRYYGDGTAEGQKVINQFIAMRDKPDYEITVYRAVPKDAKTINPGDWVTTVKSYADEHGYRQYEEGEYTVLSKKVKAKEIFTEGNSIFEFGYSPTERQSEFFQSVPIMDGRENLRKYGLDERKRNRNQDVALALQSRQRIKYGYIGPLDVSKEAENKIASWIAAEVRYKVKQTDDPNSAVGWYSTKFNKGLDTLAKKYPELNSDSSFKNSKLPGVQALENKQNARDFFTLLVAMTSDGQKVKQNFALAADIYDKFRNTGLVPESGNFGGERNASMIANAKRINKMVAEKGFKGTRDFLLQVKTVSELNAIAAEEKLSFASGFLVTTKLPMASVVIGDKLGTFYANLMGFDGYVTMDRWFARTINRYRGDLLMKPTNIGMKNFRELIGQPELTDEETILATIEPARAYARSGFKDKSQINQSANTIYKAAFGGLKDKPNSKTDRKFMQDVVTNARKKLKKSGINLTEADIQAILWYYEKQLYGELGAVASQEISYEEAADILVNNKKVVPGINVEGPGGQQTEIYDQDKGLKRGSIQFRNVGQRNQATIISLFSAADNSTFLHESGHFFLQVMQDVAESAEASDAIKADWAVTLKYLGVESGADIGVKEHELWAESFEQYLFNGKAPTIEMQGPFRKFKEWLKNVYTQATGLGIEITPEITEVFDRLLGTKEEIRLAQQQETVLAQFETPDVLNIDETTWQKYQDSVQAARQEAEDDFDHKKMLEVTRQGKQDYKDRLEAMKIEVTKEAEAMPVYKAIHFLRTGEDITSKEAVEGMPHVQFDTKSLKDAFGPRILGELPRGPKMHTNKGGVHHEEIAEMFGFESGLDMITQLKNAQPIKKFIQSESELRVARDTGALSLDKKKLLIEAAKSAASSKARSKLLALESDLLTRKAGIAGTPPNVLQEMARRLIANKTISSIHVKQARAAEVRAYLATQKAIEKEDWTEAAKQKVTQTLNYFIYREAELATERMNVMLRYFDRISKPKYAKNLERSAIDSIYSLLEKVDLRRTVGTRKQTYAAWVKAQEAEGIEVPNADEIQALLENPNKTHYKDMTYGEFVKFYDSVKSIESIARYKQNIIKENEKIAYGELVDELVNTALTEHGEWKIDSPDFTNNIMKYYMQFKGDVLATHDKMEFVFEMMDGDVVNGVWWNTFFNRIADAENAETVMNEQYIGKLTQIIESRYTQSERRAWQNTVSTRKGKFSKENIISIALNWGNEGNQTAVLDGFTEKEKEWGISTADIEQMLDRHMEARDWEMVQEVWDLIDNLWPEIAAMQKRLTGLVPPKVAAKGFKTRFGTLKGGYYPLYYSREFSYKARAAYETSLGDELYATKSWSGAATQKGHLEARTDSAGQLVRMDLKVLSEHMSNVIHDLTYREAIYDLNRLIKNDKIAAAIKGVAGKEVYAKIFPWIQRIANPKPPAYHWVDNIVNYANTSATMVAMGFKVTTAAVQFFGYTQTVDYLGKQWAWRGLTSYYAHPLEAKEAIFARSPMMRNRTKTLDRDVREAISNITGKDSKFKEIKSKYFYFIGMMDMFVSLPTWTAGYEKAIHEGLSEKEAIAQGDSAVRMTQSSGSLKDMADIQGREDTLYKTFTKFYSYFSAYWNMSMRNSRLRQAGKRTKLESMESFFWLTVLPATLAEALLGRGPNRDDDDDNDNVSGWGMWAAQNAATFRFNGLVFVRDMINSIKHPEYGVESPWQDLFSSAYRMPGQLENILSGDDSLKDWKGLLLGISYIFQLPGRQMTNMLEHLGEVIEEGEEFSLYELMVSVNRND